MSHLQRLREHKAAQEPLRLTSQPPKQTTFADSRPDALESSSKQLPPDQAIYRSARQNAVLRMQQQYGNAAVQRMLAAEKGSVRRDARRQPAPVGQAADPSQVQRWEYASCTPARMSGEECPARERGERERAASGDMAFVPLKEHVNGEDGNLVANFDIGSAAIKPNLNTLKVWTNFVNGISKNGSKWEIVGFSDCEGKEAKNQGIREARANAVFNLLPKAVQGRITSKHAAPEGGCLTGNDTASDRTINRSAALFLDGREVDFAGDPDEPITANIPTQEPGTESCSAAQKKLLSVAFPLGKKMIETARRTISNMTKGSEEEKVFMKFFGPDAFEHRWHINRGYNDTLRAWKENPIYKCVKDGTDPCTKATEGYTGVRPFITGNGIIICERSFNSYHSPIDLAEVIVHEEAHARDWDDDKKYCTHSGGCDLSTTQAEANADSYSAFAGEAFKLWG